MEAARMNADELKTYIRKLNLMLHSQRKNLTRAECSFLLETIRKQAIELEAATEYIGNFEVVHKRTKKDVPTVIEYQGKEYILDYRRVKNEQ
jgi:hypothetical protein